MRTLYRRGRGGVLLLLLILLLSMGKSAFAWDEEDRVDITPETGWEGDYSGEVFINTVLVHGKVLAVLEEEEISEEFTDQPVTNQRLKVRLTSGEFSGEEIIVDNFGVGNPVYDIQVVKGEKIVVGLEVEEGEIIQAYVADYLRDSKVYTLAVFFFVLMLGFGWGKGAKALCSLVFTLILVWMVLIPGFLHGYNVISLTMIVSIIIIVVTAILNSGFTRKSLAAMIGAAGGLGVAGLLAVIMGNIAHLTGFRNGEAEMLQYIFYDITFNIRGILFMAIVIGALGAVMEVSLRVSLAVEEVKREKPEMSVGDLMKFGILEGRDLAGKVSNTLILACIGGSLPLLIILTAYRETLAKIINLDMLASEIVRALSGAIGLILAVPLTALVAGFFYGEQKPRKIETGKSVNS